MENVEESKTIQHAAVSHRILHSAFYILHLNVVLAGNAPASSGYQPGALLLSYRTETDSWFLSEAHRTKNEGHLYRRADSEDSLWFVALAKEQLALISDNRFHKRLLSLHQPLRNYSFHSTRNPGGLSSCEMIN